MTTISDYEKSIIALTCFTEFPGELWMTGLFGAMALRNRAKAGWFEGSIYQNAIAVLRERNRVIEFPDSRDPALTNLLTRLDSVYSDEVPDRTGGALYWIRSDAAELVSGERTGQIGRYVFFR